MDVFSSTQKSSFIPFALSTFLISVLTLCQASPTICNAQESGSVTTAIPPLPSSEEHLRLAALLGPHAYLPTINPSKQHRPQAYSRDSISTQVALGLRLLRESQIWWVINAESSEPIESSPSDRTLVNDNGNMLPALVEQTAPVTVRPERDIQAHSPLPVQLITGNPMDEKSDTRNWIHARKEIDATNTNGMVGSAPIILYIEEPYLSYDLSVDDHNAVLSLKESIVEGLSFDGVDRNERNSPTGSERIIKNDLALNAIRLHASKPLTSPTPTSEIMRSEPPTTIDATAIDNSETPLRTMDTDGSSSTKAGSVASSDSPPRSSVQSQVPHTTKSDQVWDDFDRLIATETAITIADVRTIRDSDTKQYQFTKQPQNNSVSFATRQLTQALITLGKIESFAQQQIRSEMSSQWQAFQERWEHQRSESRRVERERTQPSAAGLALLSRAEASTTSQDPRAIAIKPNSEPSRRAETR